MHVGLFGLRRCGWTVTLTGPESDLIFGMQLFLYMIIANKRPVTVSQIARPLLVSSYPLKGQGKLDVRSLWKSNLCVG